MRRLPFVIAAVILATVVAGVVVINVPGRSGPSAPIPPSNASAPTIARAFLDAATHRDCQGMRALSSPHDTNWCPTSLWTTWKGDGGARMYSWTGLRNVSNRSDPEQCFEYQMQESGLLGMSDGSNTWGLCLDHHPVGWRVSSEGVG